MAAANTQLLHLSEAQRQTVEAWLMDFEQSWHATRLAECVRALPPPGHPLHRPALTEMVKVDQEQQWQHGSQVSLESYLKQYPELGTADTVAADLIQAEYEVRRQFGAPADLSVFARRFPRQAENLRQLVDEAQAPASGSQSLQDSELTLVPRAPVPARPQATPGPEVSTSKVVSASKATTGEHASPPQRIHPPAPPPEPLPEAFGHYLILKKLGKGGMGDVYLVRNTKLDRLEALKVPYFSPDEGPEVLERFKREARAAAALHHPNLCPVYELGEAEGKSYLTMPYIEKSLADKVKVGKSLPQQNVAAVVRKLALALQEVHTQGVIHRDLKPSNVRIDKRNEPVIIDFGLARQVNKGEVRLTATGDMMGSPAYMSPEQVSGNIDAVGPGTDIYSLGVILYELLTGRLPFQGATVGAVYAQILTEEPAPPSAHRPDLDPRLEAVCRKAMAKQVQDRYATMAEMAAALTAYLRAGSQPSTELAPGPRPALVPPVPTPPSSVQPPLPRQPASTKWRPRLPTRGWIMAVSTAAVLLSIVIVVNTDHGSVKIELSHPKANVRVEVDGIVIDSPALEQPLRLKLGDHKFVVTGEDFDIVAPESFTVRRWDNPVVQVTLIPKVAPKPNPPRPQAEGTVKIELSDPHAKVQVKVDGQTIDAVKLDKPLCLPTGEHDLVVTGKYHETISRRFVVRPGDNPELRVELLPTKPARAASAPAAVKPFVRIHDFTTPGYAWSAVFSPDDRLVLYGAGTRAKLWDRVAKRDIATLEGHTGNINHVDFSPDGRRALSACISEDRRIILWDLENQREVIHFGGWIGHARPRSFAFSPDGRLALAGGWNDNQVYLWDLEKDKVRTLGQLGHEWSIEHVTFSPNGRYALAAGVNLFLWDVETGEKGKCLEGHTEAILEAAFSPDGNQIYSGSKDKTIRKWELTTGREINGFKLPLLECWKVAFSLDCRRVLAVGVHSKTEQRAHYRVCLLDTETGGEIGRLDGEEAIVTSLAFSSDGRYAVTTRSFLRAAAGAQSSGQVYLWQLPDS